MTKKTETIEEMEARHGKEIETLQSTCLHPEITDWEKHMWAPAPRSPSHYSLFEIKTCELCGKEVASRTKCRKCGCATEDYKIGIGTHSRPGSSYYCPKCFTRTGGEKKSDEEAAKRVNEALKGFQD